MTKKLLIVALLTVSTATSHAYIFWFNSSTNRIAGSDGVTPLTGSFSDNTVGCFVQLVYAGANNSIDNAINSGTGVTGDDVVVSTGWFGQKVFGNVQGYMDGDDVYEAAGTYYVRAWSAPASNYAAGLVPTGESTYYGNSDTFSYSVPDPEAEVAFNFGGTGDGNNIGWSTNMSVAAIPEPGAVMLALIGILSARFFRRHLK